MFLFRLAEIALWTAAAAIQTGSSEAIGSGLDVFRAGGEGKNRRGSVIQNSINFFHLVRASLVSLRVIKFHDILVVLFNTGSAIS